ncbi:MAG: hypothetical protein R3A48_18970 [Polyangiales bacterium]
MRFTVTLALLVTACSGARPRANACPETHAMPCLTPVVCAMDRRRGCEVCRCDDAPGPPPRVYRPGEPATGAR